MVFSRKVEARIKRYRPKGGLDKVAYVILGLLGMNHRPVREHAERVALMVEAVAKHLKKDAKAAFFAAIFHDIGKLILPYNLFDGHDISNKEYRRVKKHALAGFKILMPNFLFIALCAGLHHAMYEKGYGLTLKDMPACLSLRTIKKILEIATIIAICDDIDSSLHRKTKLRDRTAAGLSLKKRLGKKFPDDILAVEMALREEKNFR